MAPAGPDDAGNKSQQQASEYPALIGERHKAGAGVRHFENADRHGAYASAATFSFTRLIVTGLVRAHAFTAPSTESITDAGHRNNGFALRLNGFAEHGLHA